MATQHTEMYDDVLLGLAGQCGGIQPLLAAFFSFLHRKTDFYVVHADDDNQAKMGFRAGAAEKILLQSFRKFPYKPMPPPSSGQQQPSRSHQSSATSKPASAAVRPPPLPSPQAAAAPADKAAPVPHEPDGINDSQEQKKPDGPSAAAHENTGDQLQGGTAPAPAPASSGPGLEVRYTDEGLQIPIGNGGITENYYWTQTLGEVTLYVDIPAGTRAKDLQVEISPSSIKIKLKAESEAIIEGEFPHTANASESMWTLEDNRTLVITLEKVTQTWWRSVIKGDPEIDAQKVDSTTKVEDYDEETQATIRKIMFDQKQKALGLPTSEELKMQGILEQAKYAKGSPFLPGGAYEGQELNYTGGGGAGGQPPGGGGAM